MDCSCTNLGDANSNLTNIIRINGFDYYLVAQTWLWWHFGHRKQPLSTLDFSTRLSGLSAHWKEDLPIGSWTLDCCRFKVSLTPNLNCLAIGQSPKAGSQTQILYTSHIREDGKLNSLQLKQVFQVEIKKVTKSVASIIPRTDKFKYNSLFSLNTVLCTSTQAFSIWLYWLPLHVLCHLLCLHHVHFGLFSKVRGLTKEPCAFTSKRISYPHSFDLVIRVINISRLVSLPNLLKLINCYWNPHSCTLCPPSSLACEGCHDSYWHIFISDCYVRKLGLQEFEKGNLFSGPLATCCCKPKALLVSIMECLAFEQDSKIGAHAQTLYTSSIQEARPQVTHSDESTSGMAPGNPGSCISSTRCHRIAQPWGRKSKPGAGTKAGIL